MFHIKEAPVKCKWEYVGVVAMSTQVLPQKVTMAHPFMHEPVTNLLIWLPVSLMIMLAVV